MYLGDVAVNALSALSCRYEHATNAMNADDTTSTRCGSSTTKSSWSSLRTWSFKCPTVIEGRLLRGAQPASNSAWEAHHRLLRHLGRWFTKLWRSEDGTGWERLDDLDVHISTPRWMMSKEWSEWLCDVVFSSFQLKQSQCPSFPYIILGRSVVLVAGTARRWKARCAGKPDALHAGASYWLIDFQLFGLPALHFAALTGETNIFSDLNQIPVQQIMQIWFYCCTIGSSCPSIIFVKTSLHIWTLEKRRQNPRSQVALSLQEVMLIKC